MSTAEYMAEKQSIHFVPGRAIILAVALFALICAVPPPLFPAESKAAGEDQDVPAAAESADALFLSGQKAFRDGRDEEAADFIMAAARSDWHCASLLSDPRYTTFLPPTPCSEIMNLKEPESDADPGPEVLYRLAMIRKRAPQQKGLEAMARKAGACFLQRLSADFPKSEWADNGALVTVEDGFCLVDEGPPECLAWEIRGYEGWLASFPKSEERPGILKKAAESWLALAGRYDEPAAWRSEIKAELCRGRAIEFAGALLEENPGSREAGWAMDFIAGVKASGKPYSMIPQDLVDAGP